jgi:hypothetical protein
MASNQDSPSSIEQSFSLQDSTVVSPSSEAMVQSTRPTRHPALGNDININRPIDPLPISDNDADDQVEVALAEAQHMLRSAYGGNDDNEADHGGPENIPKKVAAANSELHEVIRENEPASRFSSSGRVELESREQVLRLQDGLGEDWDQASHRGPSQGHDSWATEDQAQRG